jgi:hypothetical protein
MNPELLALLAEIDITAAADTLLWNLPLPLPIKKSSCIAASTYTVSTGELVVTLHTSRTTFSYPNTSISTVSDFIRADSPGGFYNRFLRGTE